MRRLIMMLWNQPFWSPEDGQGGGAPGGGAGGGGVPNDSGGSGGGTPPNQPGQGGPGAGGGAGGQGGDGEGGPGKFPSLTPPKPGEGDAPKPGEDKPDPNAPKPNEHHGAPEGGQYADFTLPEGFELDKGILDKFTPLANELGLSQTGAQRLADFYANEILAPQSAAFVEQISTWFKEVEADAEIGGAKFEQSTQNAQKAISVFGTPGLKSLMVQYGLGNHPEVVRFFSRVGGAISEDSAGGGTPNTAGDGQDFLTQMYGPAEKYNKM